jgi:hypothetical protein
MSVTGKTGMLDSIPRPRQKELEELSPLELKNELIELADENRSGRTRSC